MDPLQFAHLSRARSALEAALPIGPSPASAFVEAAWLTMRAQKGQQAVELLQRSDNPLIARAAASLLTDAEWNDGVGARQIAAGYLETIAEASILDLIRRYGTNLPANVANIMVASDAVGDIVTEGAPKPVKNLTLGMTDADYKKAVGLVVLSKELANATGGEGRALFERELAAAVIRASNTSVLSALVNSGTVEVTGSDDPLANLRLGLRTVGPATGFVVAMPAGDVADLATRVENRGGMGVRGGEFVPGVSVVAIDGAVNTIVIPASRIALRDGGLIVQNSSHASLDMRDTPESPAQLTSLWQTNCIALMVERWWHLAQAADVVIVQPAS